MTAEEYPIRPQIRLVEQYEFKDLKVSLFEQPDIDVDQPYSVVVDSSSLAFGVGQITITSGTLVEANTFFDLALVIYFTLPGNEHIRRTIPTGRLRDRLSEDQNVV